MLGRMRKVLQGSRAAASRWKEENVTGRSVSEASRLDARSGIEAGFGQPDVLRWASTRQLLSGSDGVEGGSPALVLVDRTGEPLP